jgi:hypothetical protein
MAWFAANSTATHDGIARALAKLHLKSVRRNAESSAWIHRFHRPIRLQNEWFKILKIMDNPIRYNQSMIEEIKAPSEFPSDCCFTWNKSINVWNCSFWWR